MPNLYGDILSDVAAQIAGSVGLAGSANIGENVSMFEAIHGSAPRRAGQNLANPSGLLLGAVMMLVHIKQTDAASRVHNAWLRTIEDGVHTYDIYDESVSKQKSARANLPMPSSKDSARSRKPSRPSPINQAAKRVRPAANNRARKRKKNLSALTYTLTGRTARRINSARRSKDSAATN
jgi:isocitrate dehydrogenase